MHTKPTAAPTGRLGYKPREVAELIGVSESGVRNLIKRGTLRAVRLDGRWIIPARVLEELLNAASVPPAAAEVPQISA